ncbi:MAG: mechanosensitive ion channel [Lachnospiraceae bacterium]|nr:mechanosensitive ion channel [Lachnospiraceae bacterium]
MDMTVATAEMSQLGEYIEGLLPKVLDFGIRLVLAVVVILIGLKLIKFVRKIVRRSLERTHVDTGVIQFLDSLLKVALYAVLILAVVGKFGVDTTSVIALAGSAGVTIGLALQGSLSNFAGGVLILVLKPFRVGDYIIQGDLEGTVAEIQMFYTHLLTVDNKRVIIPNGSLANNSLINVSAQDKRRLDLDVGISYSADLRVAKNLMERMLEEEPRILVEEERTVVVSELADSAVIIKNRFWVRPNDYWQVKWDLTERIKLLFDTNGIEIPFQQLDVTVKNQEK